MHTTDGISILDREQLRDVTLDDEDLMREILRALIDDTSRQIPLMESAIREGDSQKCARLAHYSKGACANVGASAAAELLKAMEHQAVSRRFSEFRESLTALVQQMELLRAETL